MQQFLVNLHDEFGPARTAQCGHKGRRVSHIYSRFKNRIFYRRVVQKPHGLRWVRFCPDCIAEMTISCGWCDTPIFMGDEVSLIPHPNPGVFPIPHHAAVLSLDRQQYVGCMECYEPCPDPVEDLERRGRWVALDARSSYRGRERYMGCVQPMSRPHVKIAVKRPPRELPESWGRLRL